MKNKILIIALLLTAFAFRAYSNEVEFTKGTYAEVLAKAKAENKVLMMDFFTDWCKWCVELDKKVYTNQEVADFANANQINWKIDAEKGEGPELAKKFMVGGYPTIVFVNGDGVEIDRIYGYLPANNFLQMMKDYNEGKNTLPSIKSALEKNGDDVEANFKMGKKYSDYGDMENAKQYLGKVIKLDPDNKAGFTDDAELMIAQISNKTENIEAFVKKYPESDLLKQAYISLAEISFSDGKTDKADGYYKLLFNKYGKNDEEINFGYGQFLLSKIYAISQKKNAGESDYKQAIELSNECLYFVKGSTSEASCYYYLANYTFKLGDKVTANDYIEKAIKIFDIKSYRELQETINK